MDEHVERKGTTATNISVLQLQHWF